jgi:redox-sensitive bicupin YhaK (pirin superfamily)
MLRAISSEKMGHGVHGWLESRFHFSFAEYYNPDNINFGVLRVVNDDLVQPGTGFDTHPHQNMEIISYVLSGELTHADSMGNEQTLGRGQTQYMSAGTGVWHSEYNHGNIPLRFLQIWIFADKDGYEPNYGDYRFKWEDRNNTWLPIATSTDNAASAAPVRIHQDVNLFACNLEANNSIEFKVAAGRQAYLVLAEGSATINEIELKMRDGMEIYEEDIKITAADEDAHMIIIEMAKA